MKMKLVAVSLFLLISIGEELVACFSGFNKTSISEQSVPVFDYDYGFDLKPCYGPRPDWGGSLVCQNLDNDLQLLTPLAVTLQNYPLINAFGLENSTMRFLPAEVFRGQKFKWVDIQQSTLTALTDSDLAFVGLEKELQYLYLTDVVLQSDWDWSIFRNLSSVRFLRVKGLTIDVLDKVPEDNLMSPVNVEFADNKMTELHPEVFQNLRKLVVFEFGHNLVKSIKRTMFPIPAAELEQFDFNNNEIETVPDDMFTDMPVLTRISLENNKLLTLKEEAFKPLMNKNSIINIAISGNRLECDCRLLWIVDIFKKKRLLIVGFCAKPLELKGKMTLFLRPEQLYC